MQVRIKFEADLIITACDMEEVKRKFQILPLFTKEAMDCGIEYIDTILIEDSETYEDLSEEYNNA